MINKTIGHIILKGGTSEDLRKEYPDFPLNPTKEYFSKLGYKDSTAKKYLAKLRNNDEFLTSKSAETEKDSLESDPKLETIFLKSENANYDNLLIDTCALQHVETRNLIDQAEHVTFIKATIEEMDKVKRKKGKKGFAPKIMLYMGKILSDPQKYMLSSFPGFNNETYTDNILLQYLLILPKPIRPTLLTTDKNLAIKARMWDLSYIFYQRSSQEKNKRKLGYGAWKIIEEDKIYIEYNGSYHATIMCTDGREVRYSGCKIEVSKGDKIRIDVKVKGIIKPLYFEV